MKALKVFGPCLILCLIGAIAGVNQANAVETQAQVTPQSLREEALAKLKRLAYILRDDAGFCPTEQTQAEQIGRLNEYLHIEIHYLIQMNNYCNVIRMLNKSTDGVEVNLTKETREKVDAILDESMALQDEFSKKFGNLSLNLVLKLRTSKMGPTLAPGELAIVVTEEAEKLADKTDEELIQEFGEYNYVNIRSAILSVYDSLLQGDLKKVARPVLVEIYRQALMTYMFIDWMDKHYTKLVVIDEALKAAAAVESRKDKPNSINRQR